MSIYVKKLLELDSKALELKGRRESEIEELEAKYRDELKGLNGIIQDASVLSKKRHDEIINKAKEQIMQLEAATEKKLEAMQKHYASIRDDIAREVWQQLLKLER